MRLATTALLLAGPLLAAPVCSRRSKPPDPQSIATIELHAWNEGRKRGFQYWVTAVDVETACVSNEAQIDGMQHIVRDCSFAAQLRPRIDELVVLFEEADESQPAGERVAQEGDGHAAVFVRHDGRRRAVDSKLLDKGAELLSVDTAEWLLLGAASDPLTPSPKGWTELELRDRERAFQRTLASDGRWSCESWVMSDKTLEHVIVIRRGRIEAVRAAALLDGFADGLAPVLAGDEGQKWAATLAPEDPSAAIELQGDELVARWDRFGAELDPDCTLDAPPTVDARVN